MLCSSELYETQMIMETRSYVIPVELISRLVNYLESTQNLHL